MTYIVSRGALNSTRSLACKVMTLCRFTNKVYYYYYYYYYYYAGGRSCSRIEQDTWPSSERRRPNWRFVDVRCRNASFCHKVDSSIIVWAIAPGSHCTDNSCTRHLFNLNSNFETCCTADGNNLICYYLGQKCHPLHVNVGILKIE